MSRLCINIYLLCLFFFAAINDVNAAWTPDKFDGGSGCINMPNFNEFNKSDKSIKLPGSLGQWQSSGMNVSKGDSLKFAWNASGIYVPPKKYLVLYRIDPRFERPQVFIKSWNYATKKWDSDFDSFSGACGPGSLAWYQSQTPPTPRAGSNAIISNSCNPSKYPSGTTVPRYNMQQQIDDFVKYFNFIGRSPITVNQGDVINIKAVPASTFFGAGSNFTTNYTISSFGANPPIHYIYTDVGGLSDGLAIFGRAQGWGQFLTSQGLAPNSFVDPSQTWFYYNNDNPSLNVTPAFGMANNSAEGTALTNSLANWMNIPIGIYVHPLGINIDSNVMKAVSQPYNNNNGIANGFFYAVAQNSGVLNFMSPAWAIGTPAWGNAMFSSFSSLNSNHTIINMKSWKPANTTKGWTENDLYQIQQDMTSSGISYVEIYREVMSIEIGGNLPVLASDLIVEYIIAPAAPDSSVSGIAVASNDNIYANADGPLWIRVKSADSDYSFSGDLSISMATYNGPTVISDFIYNDVIQPIMQSLNNLTMTLYNRLVSNVTLRNIAMTLLSLYISLYGLYYLAGATEIKTYDLVARIVKITLITILFSPNSWNFFNNYLFNAFSNGTNYLIYNMIGTNSHHNIFGFLDIIFNKFTNPDLWANLLMQLLDIPDGLTFFAILVIMGLIKYFMTLIEIVVSYLMAFVTVAVLIALAPFFITFMLFKRTENLFRNWIAALANAVIYPTILLLFYLLLDDILTGLLANAVVKSCWGVLIPIKFYLSLKPIGIDWATTFSIPGFPGIPFWIPTADAGGIVGQDRSYFTIMTSSIIFFCYTQLASKLSDFVTGIVGSLTSIGAVGGGVAGQEGATAISHDFKALSKMSGNLAARAAFGAADHAPGAARAVTRAAIRAAGSAPAKAILGAGKAIASTAYHAPKNIAKGTGYVLGATGAALKGGVKALGKEGRAELSAAIKKTALETPGKVGSDIKKVAKGTVDNVGKAWKGAVKAGAEKAQATSVYKGLEKTMKAVDATGKKMNEGFEAKKQVAGKLINDTKVAISKESREARSIARKQKAAALATQKYRDHKEKLEENKAKALAKAQEKVANKRARDKKWNEIKDATVGAAGRGVSAVTMSVYKGLEKTMNAVDATGEKMNEGFEKTKKGAQKAGKYLDSKEFKDDVKKTAIETREKVGSDIKKAAKGTVDNVGKAWKGAVKAGAEKAQGTLAYKALEKGMNAVDDAGKAINQGGQKIQEYLSQESREARAIEKKKQGAAREDKKYRDYKAKLEDNKVNALKKAQESIESQKEREKKWNDVKKTVLETPGKVGQAWQGAVKEGAEKVQEIPAYKGLEKTMAAVEATGKKMNEGFEQTKKGVQKAGKYFGSKEFKDDVKKTALETPGKVAADIKKVAKGTADNWKGVVQTGAEKAQATSAYKGLEKTMASIEATGKKMNEGFAKSITEEASYNRKAARQKKIGDLGDAMIHGVKDAGLSTVINPSLKFMNKLSAGIDDLNAGSSEIGHAAMNLRRGVADKTHNVLEKGRDLKNKAAHSGVVIKTALEEGYDLGVGASKEEFAKNQKAREERVKNVDDYRSRNKDAKQREIEEKLEKRQKAYQDINDKRAAREKKKQDREDKLKQEQIDRLNTRAEKKKERDEAIDKKIAKDRKKATEAKERKAKALSTSDSQKLFDYEKRVDEGRQSDLAEARAKVKKQENKKK